MSTRWVSRELLQLRARFVLFTLIQVSGFAAFFFGAYRMFGIGIYGLNGLGPLSRDFFTAVYLPGPWGVWDTTWELAFVWMAIGAAIVGLSTRQRK